MLPKKESITESNNFSIQKHTTASYTMQYEEKHILEMINDG